MGLWAGGGPGLGRGWDWVGAVVGREYAHDAPKRRRLFASTLRLRYRRPTLLPSLWAKAMNLLTLHGPLPYPLPYPPPPPVTIPEALTIKPVLSWWSPLILPPSWAPPSQYTHPTHQGHPDHSQEGDRRDGNTEDAGKDISHHTTL
jgi:hypothetical protein